MDKEEWYRVASELYMRVWGDCSDATLEDFPVALLENWREAGMTPEEVVRERLK